MPSPRNFRSFGELISSSDDDSDDSGPSYRDSSARNRSSGRHSDAGFDRYGVGQRLGSNARLGFSLPSRNGLRNESSRSREIRNIVRSMLNNSSHSDRHDRSRSDRNERDRGHHGRRRRPSISPEGRYNYGSGGNVESMLEGPTIDRRTSGRDRLRDIREPWSSGRSRRQSHSHSVDPGIDGIDPQDSDDDEEHIIRNIRAGRPRYYDDRGQLITNIETTRPTYVHQGGRTTRIADADIPLPFPSRQYSSVNSGSMYDDYLHEDRHYSPPRRRHSRHDENDAMFDFLSDFDLDSRPGSPTPPRDLEDVPLVATGRRINTSRYTTAVLNAPADATCPICTDGKRPGEDLRKPRNCEHLFHLDCLDEWVNGPAQNSNKCPVCRVEFIREQRQLARGDRSDGRDGGRRGAISGQGGRFGEDHYSRQGLDSLE